MKLKPCPFCRSENLLEESDAVMTSMLGIDRQCGWIECLDCKCSGPVTHAVDCEIDNLRSMVIHSWNNRDQT